MVKKPIPVRKSFTYYNEEGGLWWYSVNSYSIPRNEYLPNCLYINADFLYGCTVSNPNSSRYKFELWKFDTLYCALQQLDLSKKINVVFISKCKNGQATPLRYRWEPRVGHYRADGRYSTRSWRSCRWTHDKLKYLIYRVLYNKTTGGRIYC